jgi:hypothetical protein
MELPVSVIFNQVNVISMSSNSIISTGQNSQPDWNAQGKLNTGNGFYINAASLGNFSFVNDPDVADTPITQPENINPQPVSQI